MVRYPTQALLHTDMNASLFIPLSLIYADKPNLRVFSRPDPHRSASRLKKLDANSFEMRRRLVQKQTLFWKCDCEGANGRIELMNRKDCHFRRLGLARLATKADQAENCSSYHANVKRLLKVLPCREVPDRSRRAISVHAYNDSFYQNRHKLFLKGWGYAEVRVISDERWVIIIIITVCFWASEQSSLRTGSRRKLWPHITV
jgi:hypothetical protein